MKKLVYCSTCGKENNFEILLESVNVKKFHVHSHQLEDILVSNKDETFYVCDHC